MPVTIEMKKGMTITMTLVMLAMMSVLPVYTGSNEDEEYIDYQNDHLSWIVVMLIEFMIQKQIVLRMMTLTIRVMRMIRIRVVVIALWTMYYWDLYDTDDPLTDTVH
jgi:hypothetical protein